MPITLIIEPGKVVTWPVFSLSAAKSKSPSVALDGYVRGATQFDSGTPCANFNHHEDVDRLSTRATCAQTLIAIRHGFMSAYRNSRGTIEMSVYVNDCDEDVCLSWYLLSTHYLNTSSMNPAINRLVAVEDMLDSTAGAYPYPADLPMLQKMAWVFQPYRLFRQIGGIERLNAQEYRCVIDDVVARIEAHVTDGGGSIELDVRYERIGNHKTWSMVREIGTHARTGMFSDGINAFVSAKTYSAPAGAQNRWAYTIGRMSPFIPFDVPYILEELDREEVRRGGNIVDGCVTGRWGGSNTIGGSPRGIGSVIPPDDVTKIVDECIREHAE